MATPTYRACVSCDAYYGCKFYNGPFLISPLDKQLKTTWWQSLNFDPANVTLERFYVCGRHFTRECFQKKTRLKKTAVPTLFNSVDWNRMFDFNFDDSTAKCSSISDDIPPNSKCQKLDGSTELETNPAQSSQISDGKVSSEGYKQSQGSLGSSSQQSDLDISFEEPADTCSLVDFKTAKFFVYGAQILTLFTKCFHENCCSIIDPNDLNISYFGSAVRIHWSCLSGHEGTWNSQPFLCNNSVAQGNVELSAAVVLTGNSFGKFCDFADCINLRVHKSATHYKIQEKCIYPVIRNTYINHTNDLLKKIEIDQLSGAPTIEIAADGQCDSPGFCAQFCTVSIMNLADRKIIGTAVKNVMEESVRNSSEMELLGLKSLLQNELQSITIGALCTDKHTAIRRMMREQFNHISHQYDIWHLTKTLQNGWMLLDYDEIATLFWHGKLCLNVIYIGAVKMQTDFLKLIYDNNILEDLRHCTRNLCTSFIECFHSKRMKYLPKRVHFSDESIHCRSFLAVLDHNANVSIENAANVSIENAEEKRYQRFCQTTDSVRPVSKKKTLNFAWREHLMQEVLTHRQTLNENISSRNICNLAKPKSLCPKQQRPTLESVIMSMSQDDNFDYLHSDDSDMESEY